MAAVPRQDGFEPGLETVAGAAVEEASAIVQGHQPRQSMDCLAEEGRLVALDGVEHDTLLASVAGQWVGA